MNKIQFRRGTDAERQSVILDSGEPGWTTDTKKLYVGDGETPGGILVSGGGGGGGAGTLCELSDVNCAGTVNGKVLTYQSGTWRAGGTVVTEQIPNLDASKITSGVFDLARIPTMDDAHIPDVETLSYGGTFAEEQIPDLPTSKITSGVFDVDRIPVLPTDRYGSAVLKTGDETINGTKTFSAIPILPATDPTSDNEAVRKAYVDAQVGGGGGGAGTLCELSDVNCAGTVNGKVLTYQSGTWRAGGTVVTEQIPNLDASKITSGVFDLARIPTMDDAHIPDVETLSYGGTFAEEQIPDLPTSKITSGVFDVDRIPVLPTDRYGSAVLKTGDETINGTKTFSAIPILPATDPTSDNEAVRKAYVDAQVGGGGGGAGTLCELSDVNCAGTVNGKVLTYQSGTWRAGGTVVTEQIPNLDASKITSGVFDLARIPTMDDAHIPDVETLSYGGTFAEEQIPDLPTSKITSGVFDVDRIPVLPTDRYGSAVLVDGSRAMTGALRLVCHSGTTGMATVTGAIFFDTSDNKVKVYIA